MQFNDITGAVNDAWLFIWPPFVMVLTAYFCARLLSPSGTKQALAAGWQKLKSASTHFESMRVVLEVYGLSKLIPITSLVVIISMLYLLNGPIIIACSKLPPHLSYVPSVIIERSGKDELLLLLRKYPTADGINQAYSFAHEVLYTDPNYQSRRYDQVQMHYRIQNFIKFAFVCLLFSFLLHILNGRPILSLALRLIVGMSVIAVIWMVALVPLLYNQEQSFNDDWRKIQISLQSEANELLSAPINEDEKRMLEQHSLGDKWWRIDFYDSDIVEWAKRNLIRGDWR